MAYCTRCGKALEEGDLFCHACGAPVHKGGQPGVPVPPSSGTRPEPAAPPSAPVPPARPAAPLPPARPGPEPTLREKAEQRVKNRVELLEHIGTYVVINGFLVVVWALTSRGYPWFLWVMAAWGVGLLFHIFSYFMGSRDDSARHRMIEREMRRMQGEPPAAQSQAHAEPGSEAAEPEDAEEREG